MFDEDDSEQNDNSGDVESIDGDETSEGRGGSIPTPKSTAPLLSPGDRSRGILSNTDREYLCGLKDYKHEQSEANRRQDIRERVKNGLEDFILLWLRLDDDDREKLFSEMGPDLVEISTKATIAFLYLGIDQNEDRFEKLLAEGIYLGGNSGGRSRWSGEVTDVDVSIDIERNPDIDKIRKKLDRGEQDELSPAEIGVLVREGKLDSDDLESLRRSRQSTPLGQYLRSTEENG